MHTTINKSSKGQLGNDCTREMFLGGLCEVFLQMESVVTVHTYIKEPSFTDLKSNRGLIKKSDFFGNQVTLSYEQPAVGNDAVESKLTFYILASLTRRQVQFAYPTSMIDVL